MDSIIDFCVYLSRQSTSEKLNFHHGCVITKGKNILSYASNTSGNRILGKSVPTQHSEMNATSALLKKLKNPSLNRCYSSLATRKKWCEKVGYLYC